MSENNVEKSFAIAEVLYRYLEDCLYLSRVRTPLYHWSWRIKAPYVSARFVFSQ